MCAESLALSSPCLPTVPFPTPCQKATWKAEGSWFGLVHLKRFFSSAISQSFLTFLYNLGDFTEKFYPAVGLPILEVLPLLWMRGEEFSQIILDMSFLTCAPLHTEYFTYGCFAFALAPYSSRFTGRNISVVCLKFAE